MVDIGISYKQVKEKLTSINIDLSQISVIFITHDHSDHTKGLDVFLKNNPDTQVYILKSTLNNIKGKYLENKNYNFINYNEEYQLLNSAVSIFQTSHDAKGSFGMIINTINQKIVHMTDSGYISSDNLNKMKNAHVYVIESNYEDEILMKSEHYPYLTKKRIMSDNGHLSNKQCNEYLKQLICEDTKKIIYAHLSKKNNNKELVLNHSKCFECDIHVFESDEIVVVDNV